MKPTLSPNIFPWQLLKCELNVTQICYRRRPLPVISYIIFLARVRRGLPTLYLNEMLPLYTSINRRKRDTSLNFSSGDCLMICEEPRLLALNLLRLTQYQNSLAKEDSVFFVCFLVFRGRSFVCFKLLPASVSFSP